MLNRMPLKKSKEVRHMAENLNPFDFVEPRHFGGHLTAGDQ